MFVLIVGGEPTGTQLASLLLAQDHRVVLIERRQDILARIHHALPTEAVYEGNALLSQVLEQAGVREADVLAACTPNDADNLALCFLVRSRYAVPRTIAQINDPQNAWLFDQKFHVDVALNQTQILASLIEEEMSLGELMPLLKIRRGQYSIFEERIPPGARAIGIPIKDLDLPEQCVIAAIIRHGEIVVPRGVTTMEAEDEVLAVTDREGAEQLAALFAPPSEEER